MATAKKGQKTAFSVVFDGAQLPSADQERISAAISKAVMQELAKLDFKGKFEVPKDFGGSLKKVMGATRGLILRPIGKS